MDDQGMLRYDRLRRCRSRDYKKNVNKTQSKWLFTQWLSKFFSNITLWFVNESRRQCPNVILSKATHMPNAEVYSRMQRNAELEERQCFKYSRETELMETKFKAYHLNNFSHFWNEMKSNLNENRCIIECLRLCNLPQTLWSNQYYHYVIQLCR